MKKHDIIIPRKAGDCNMTELICTKCYEMGKPHTFRIDCAGDIRVKGIIQCLQCKHEFPFEIYRSYIHELASSLPGAYSSNLNSLVPSDIQDDVKEAERANFALCYKACVTMCRRALQLSLMEKGISDKPLGKMLGEAKSNNLLSLDTFNLATSIKGFGDIGAHRKGVLEPQEVNMLIYCTVKMLNELFK